MKQDETTRKQMNWTLIVSFQHKINNKYKIQFKINHNFHLFLVLKKKKSQIINIYNQIKMSYMTQPIVKFKNQIIGKII
jgi:hypothetical protein